MPWWQPGLTMQTAECLRFHVPTAAAGLAQVCSSEPLSSAWLGSCLQVEAASPEAAQAHDRAHWSAWQRRSQSHPPPLPISDPVPPPPLCPPLVRATKPSEFCVFLAQDKFQPDQQAPEFLPPTARAGLRDGIGSWGRGRSCNQPFSRGAWS